jgi:hypothetical protein
VLKSLREYPDVRVESGRILTGWSRERPAQEQGLLLGNAYRCRVRHDVFLEGSVLRVRSAVVRRAPGGARSIRWERVDPEGAERALLESIDEKLEKLP